MLQPILEPRTRRRLVWEWRVALITVIGVFVVAIVFLGYRAWQAAHAPKPMAAAEQQKVNAEATAALCTAGLDRAKAYGIVPGYAKLAAIGLELTGVKGRYTCLAATSVTQYRVTADLVCRDLRDQRCVALYSVKQQDGTVLYQRRR